MQIDKASARQLLAQSLPVPSNALAASQKALASIGTKARQARAQASLFSLPAHAVKDGPTARAHALIERTAVLCSPCASDLEFVLA